MQQLLRDLLTPLNLTVNLAALLLLAVANNFLTTHLQPRIGKHVR